MLLDLFLIRFSLILLFSCGGLSWLHISFFYCTLNTKYHIVLSVENTMSGWQQQYATLVNTEIFILLQQ